MNIWITYLIIAAALIVAELLYFKLADRFNIIDKEIYTNTYYGKSISTNWVRTLNISTISRIV